MPNQDAEVYLFVVQRAVVVEHEQLEYVVEVPKPNFG